MLNNKNTINFIRKYCTKIKPKIIPNEKVLIEIEQNIYKPRNHPGVRKPKIIFVPNSFIDAIQNVICDYPIKSLLEAGEILSRHLKGKQSPMEKEEIKTTMMKVQEKVENKLKTFPIKNEVDSLRYTEQFKNKVNYILKQKIYNWKPETYDTFNCLVYLLGRSAGEYAVLMKIFHEINIKDNEFQPRTLFDFGSGVGTVTWAAKEFWKKSIFEYFNVDASGEMNDLAQILLQDGKGTKQKNLKGVFYRQFLPASNTSYDLVVSAYTLLELPSRQSRLDTILNLWNKTVKYLVVVEQGTNAGFKVINEIRDFILHLKNGYVFSPCPHDEICPRFVLNDDTPCNFEIAYFTLPIGAKSERKLETYSYVVLKKGERDTSDPQWPRIVRKTQVRSKHTICRMCTKNGQLQETIFTAAKHGKTLYHCARSSNWGDLLPIDIINNTENESI